MKRTEIIVGKVYCNSKGTLRKVLSFQKGRGKSFGTAGWLGGSPTGDNLSYEIIEGRGKGQTNVMTVSKFATWAKGKAGDKDVPL